MQEVPVNYLAVLAAAISSMVLGFLWYGPLFGKTWARMMGWENMDPAKVAEMKKGAMKGYLVSFVGALLMAFVLSHVLTFAEAYMNTEGVSAGLTSGFWNWLGFVAPVTVGAILWEGKSVKLWVLNNGYHLAQLLIMGVILALWK